MTSQNAVTTTHRPKCLQGVTLAAGANEGVEGDDVGLAAVAVHLLQQLKRQLPAPSLLAGRDQAAVGDHVALATALHHVLEYPQRLLYLQECATV